MVLGFIDLQVAENPTETVLNKDKQKKKEYISFMYLGSWEKNYCD